MHKTDSATNLTLRTIDTDTTLIMNNNESQTTTSSPVGSHTLPSVQKRLESVEKENEQVRVF